MRYFCTYFDENYLSRGLALYESLTTHCHTFTLFVLCMNDHCYQELEALKLANIRAIRLAELEANDPELQHAHTNRSKIEYYFTCSPILPLAILRQNPTIDLITYLDADLYFFHSPEEIFTEIGDHSITIIEHRYPENISDLNAYGIYNVGWISFRNDQHGLACLQWWRERCLEWCHDRLEGNRYADQKYLEQWAERFEGVHVLQHTGANLAPWNLMRYTLHEQDGRIYVDQQPLIFYHFHGFKQKLPWLYDTHTARYSAQLSSVARRSIYAKYIRVMQRLNKIHPLKGGIRTAHLTPQQSWNIRRFSRIWHYLHGLSAGNYIVHGLGFGTLLLALIEAYQLFAVQEILGPLAGYT